MGATHLRWGVMRTLVAAIKTTMAPGSASLPARLAVLPRLVGASLRGQYPGLSRTTIAMMLGATAYILMPVDVIPEVFLGVFGVADDAFVLTWLAATLVNATEDFMTWERGTPSTPQDRFEAYGGPEPTVQSYVVK